jgi:hypothetical protein
MQHYYAHFGYTYSATGLKRNNMSSQPPDPNETTTPEFAISNVSDEIMEYWQLAHAVSALMSYCTEEERKILQKIRRMIIREFFDKLAQNSKMKWSVIKRSIDEDLEYWKKEQEKLQKEQEETKEEEKPKRTRKKTTEEKEENDE